MVKVTEEKPLTSDGRLDIQAWLPRLGFEDDLGASSLLIKALVWVHELDEKHGSYYQTPYEVSCYQQGLDMAELLSKLINDEALLSSALILNYLHLDVITLAEVEERLSPEVSHLVKGVMQMKLIETLQIRKQGQSEGKSEGDSQVAHLDKLRKMLLAMVEDLRVVLLKLAEHLCDLRQVSQQEDNERKRLARLSRDLFGPLSNRLGIGQFKWELEDLSFRYLEPGLYKQIARLLDEKRLARESYIKDVVGSLTSALQEDGVRSEIDGRAKHIYSIWRKMARKNLPFSEIYDVRALRILVEDERDCYAALGTVHRLWRHIPKEFDDYIAIPKPNGYRSLHTAIIGPEGKTVEIQIRTHAMHQESELGVASHWRYKEGVNFDDDYEQKITWLRQLLDYQAEAKDVGSVFAELTNNVMLERVYVLTPRGDVLDLPKGATPIDFAYRVHTDIGHRTRGAKISGRIVPLSYCLSTGDQVEILTGNEERPSRDWLNTNLNYVRTQKARHKIQHFFRRQDRSVNIQEGKIIFERELNRLRIQPFDLGVLAAKLNVHSADDILASLGTGDIRFAQIIQAAELKKSKSEQSLSILDLPKRNAEQVPANKATPKDVSIQGVGNLMTEMAGCCKPVSGDDVIGYITNGRGVTIHRQDCKNVLHLMHKHPERILDVSWGLTKDGLYNVDLFLKAYDRPNLLKDITSVLSNEKINLLSLNSKINSQEHTAFIDFTVEINNLSKLSKLMDRLKQLGNVIEVGRN